jgi:hypothetical protein
MQPPVFNNFVVSSFFHFGGFFQAGSAGLQQIYVPSQPAA